jgi:hypothetical protein
MVADPRREGDVYACANSGFFGPMLFRSSNWGARWQPLGMPLLKATGETGPDGRPKSPIANLWHIEPGAEAEPESVFLGIDPASLFRSDDRGKGWNPVLGLNEHETRPKWNPGAGGMCLHTILLDPTNPKRMYVGISAAGTFRSDDEGDHWRALNRGVIVSFLPEKRPEVGQCVHKIALDAGDPKILYRQDHDGIHVSNDRMETWKRVGRSLDSDFGFVTATARALPGQAIFVPLEGMGRVTLGGHLQIYRYTAKDRRFQPLLGPRQWVGQYGTHREGLAADNLDPAGIYLGTTTGQLIYSANAGQRWEQIPFGFPSIHSVSVGHTGS